MGWMELVPAGCPLEVTVQFPIQKSNWWYFAALHGGGGTGFAVSSFCAMAGNEKPSAVNEKHSTHNEKYWARVHCILIEFSTNH
jgi:hypothetical protein